jgi:hypothetical protein
MADGVRAREGRNWLLVLKLYISKDSFLILYAPFGTNLRIMYGAIPFFE